MLDVTIMPTASPSDASRPPSSARCGSRTTAPTRSGPGWHFPVRRVADYADRVPRPGASTARVLPMYQREAMWLNFHGTAPNAVKVAIGKVNAISGEPYHQRLDDDYVVVPPQPWLDGINAGDGFISSSSRCRSAWATPSRARSPAPSATAGCRSSASRPSRAASRSSRRAPRTGRSRPRSLPRRRRPRWACAPAAGCARDLSRPARRRHLGPGQLRPRVRAHRQQPTVPRDHRRAGPADPGRRTRVHERRPPVVRPLRRRTGDIKPPKCSRTSRASKRRTPTMGSSTSRTTARSTCRTSSTSAPRRSRTGSGEVEARGIEPLPRPCKGRVLPLSLRPRERPQLTASTASTVAALMSTVSLTSGA